MKHYISYWLFGTEACEAYRNLTYYNYKPLKDAICKHNYGLHCSNSHNANYGYDLLNSYNGWNDYQRISKELYTYLIETHNTN